MMGSAKRLSATAKEVRAGQEHGRAAHENDADRPPPPLRDGQLCHRRNEYQLAGACRRAERADDHAALRAEPAVGDRRAEHAANGTGPEPDGESPEHVHLPEIADEDESEEPSDDENVAHEHHATRSEAIDERPAEGTAQPERQDAERDRKRDRSPRPTEFRLE